MKPNLDSEALTVRPNRLDSHVATLPAAGSSCGAAPAPGQALRAGGEEGAPAAARLSQGPGPSGTLDPFYLLTAFLFPSLGQG